MDKRPINDPANTLGHSEDTGNKRCQRGTSAWVSGAAWGRASRLLDPKANGKETAKIIQNHGFPRIKGFQGVSIINWFSSKNESRQIGSKTILRYPGPKNDSTASGSMHALGVLKTFFNRFGSREVAELQSVKTTPVAFMQIEKCVLKTHIRSYP